MPSFCRDAVTVWRAPLVPERGTKIRDWAQAVAHTVAGCSLQPSGGGVGIGATSGTFGEQRNGAEVHAVLYAPPGADIEFSDRIEFGGVNFALVGEPLEYRSPTGRVTHMACSLTYWRG